MNVAGHGDVLGRDEARHNLYICRQNLNHFVPLIRSLSPARPMHSSSLALLGISMSSSACISSSSSASPAQSSSSCVVQSVAQATVTSEEPISAREGPINADQGNACSMPNSPPMPQEGNKASAEVSHPSTTLPPSSDIDSLLAGCGFAFPVAPAATCGGCNAINLENSLDQELDDSSSDSEDSPTDDENGVEELYFACAVDPVLCDLQQVELDIVHKQCCDLRQRLRSRPTLPLKADGDPMSVEELNVGFKLPLY